MVVMIDAAATMETKAAMSRSKRVLPERKVSKKPRMTMAGLTAVARYHFLPLGIFVPYLELGAGPGSTDLKVREINSDFAFLLFGGAGAQVFLSESLALYGGYRLVHISNGNTSRPNRGFEANTGVGGLSFYFK